MLAPFEDDRVGAVGPTIHVSIPRERRHPDKTTPWEVAGTRIQHNRKLAMLAMHAGQQWCTVLTGLCFLRPPRRRHHPGVPPRPSPTTAGAAAATR